MKILITGGAGYIGAALAEKLSFLPEIEEVRIYDNLISGNFDFFFHSHVNKAKVTFFEGDILETRKLNKILKDITTVIHLASAEDVGSDNKSLHHYEQVNTWGTAELTYALEKFNIPSVIHVSTHEVYGFSENAKTEDAELNPSTPYALSRVRGEEHILRLKDRMKTFIIRPGIVVGHSPVKNLSGAPNKLLYDALIRKRISLHGDGKQIRPVTSLNYLISAIEKAVSGQIEAGIYNIAQANLSVLDMLDSVKEILPETEFIFTNHHFALPSILLSSNNNSILTTEEFSLKNEYEQILKYFRI